MAVVAHPRLTLACAGVVLAACIALALTRLGISTDQNKLFSSDVAFFRDYLSFIQKFPENEAIYIVIEASAQQQPAVQRWVSLADAIAASLRNLPQYVKSVDCRVPVDELGRQGILFEQRDRLKQTLADVQRFAPLARLWAEKPNVLTGLLGSTPLERFLAALGAQQPDEETSPFVRLLADSWTATARSKREPLRVGRELPDLASLDASDPSRLGYYYVPDETDRGKHLMLIRVYHREDFTSLTAISNTVEAIREAARKAATGYSEFNVGVTGRPALDADEMRSTDRDTTRAEIVALSVVFVGLVLMLRSVWLALAAELALGVGIGWTFGWATLAVGELNLLSIVFLIALIGIGMDYLIQILVRYRRESRRYTRDKAIWVRVYRYIGPPIVTACFGAAGAFFVAVFTDFQGAADLGIIAGAGLLLCLLSGYTVLPALLVLFPAKAKDIDPAKRYANRPPRLGGKRHLLLPALWLALLLGGIPLMMRTRFNPNLLELQAPNLESVKLVRKLQTWSAVVLSRDLSTLRQARQALAGAPTVASTESVLDAGDNEAWLQEHEDQVPQVEWSEPSPVRPEDLPRIEAKSRALADRFSPQFPQAADALRNFAAAIAQTPATDRQLLASRLTRWQEGFVQLLRESMRQLSPPPLDVSRLPVEFRSHLVSQQGDYALYIYPRQDLWRREQLGRFVREVEARVATVAGAPSLTGIAPNIYHSTRAVERSFYKATAYALALIFLLVLFDLRRLGQTLLAISVVVLGLPMLIALMGLLDVSWNFANFFGLPILIGAAHEYGVFLIHRYREVVHDPRRVWVRWDTSDRALLLCAFVTSSSFAFFWALGHHEGLRSLGLVMAAGSACIYVTSVLLVRPLLMWRLEQRARNWTDGVEGGTPCAH
jgi:hopanoid biosynthesis associated RND transporter like protein HpnN